MSKKPEPESAASDSQEADLRAEASVLEQAREALHRAEEAYRRSLHRVAGETSRARGVTVGDILDGTLEFVRRHPVIGMLAVGTVSFLLGKTTRR